jgi:hypothetical protein
MDMNQHLMVLNIQKPPEHIPIAQLRRGTLRILKKKSHSARKQKTEKEMGTRWLLYHPPQDFRGLTSQLDTCRKGERRKKNSHGQIYKVD